VSLRRAIHRSAWKKNSRKVASRILHMRRHRESFWSSEAGMHREGDHNFWWRGYKFKVASVAFVLTNQGILTTLA
jgi:hypothetical protein